MCLGVCQRECERVSETDFYSFFSFESSGHCAFKVHISQVSHNMSSFLTYWRSLSHDQSTNSKGQGCDFCIPLPILPPSMHLILTQEDSANSFLRFELGCASKPALPLSLPSMELDFFVKSALRPQPL